MLPWFASTFRQVARVTTYANELLRSISPPRIALSYWFYAALMVLVTWFCGLAEFPIRNGERVAGYCYELNWAPNHLVFIPLALLCSALVLRELHRVPERLTDRQMVLDPTSVPAIKKVVTDSWEAYAIRPMWLLVIVVLAFGSSWAEWSVPLLKNPAVAAGFDLQPGWTTQYLNEGFGLKAILSFLAFTAQGFVVTVFLYAFGNIVQFSTWIYSLVSDPGKLRLVPDVSSLDFRRGFEIFEPLIVRLIFAALSFVLVLFSIRVQGIYTYSASDARTVYAFLIDNMVAGFFVDVSKIFQGQWQNADLFDIGAANNYSSVIVFMATSTLVLLVLIVPSLILAVVAQESKDQAEADVNQGRSGGICRGVAGPNCLQLLTSMELWPLRYPRPVELLCYVAFAAFCFIFYKFTLLLLGSLFISLVFKVWKVISRNTGVTSGGPGTGPPSPAVIV